MDIHNIEIVVNIDRRQMQFALLDTEQAVDEGF
jgi:hypothetical protein